MTISKSEHEALLLQAQDGGPDAVDGMRRALAEIDALRGRIAFDERRLAAMCELHEREMTLAKMDAEQAREERNTERRLRADDVDRLQGEIRRRVAEEREACAKIADDYHRTSDGMLGACEGIAEDIRARGTP